MIDQGFGADAVLWALVFGFDHEKTQGGAGKRAGAWIPDRNARV
jgi:hypothetical protein